MQAELLSHGMRVSTLAPQTCFPLVTLFKARLEAMSIPGWRVWSLPQGVDAECEQQPCSPELLPSAYPPWWFLLAIFPSKASQVSGEQMVHRLPVFLPAVFSSPSISEPGESRDHALSHPFDQNRTCADFSVPHYLLLKSEQDCFLRLFCLA